MGTLQVGVGLSQAEDSETAAREASRLALAQAGLGRAAWALCFFSASHLRGAEPLRAAILDETGCAALSGCSAMGVIAGAREVERAPAVAVLVGGGEAIQPHSTVLTGEGEGLPDFAGPLLESGGAPLILALPDAFQINANALRTRLNADVAGARVYGAGATDDGMVGMSLQLGMEGVRSRSVALLGLAGDFEAAVGITQSCTVVGEPHFITHAEENILIELDGKPALPFLMELGRELGLRDFQQLVSEVMFGFPLDTENPGFTGETCLVRALGGLDQESQGLVLPFPLRNQTNMAFMHRNPRTAERDMGRMLTDLGGRLSGPPDLGIYFDCAGRGTGFYGRPGVDTEKIQRQFGEFPLIGMFGGFELATAMGLSHIYTYTGVLLLLRGRE